MSYNPETNPEDKKSILGVIIHSFFVVPFLLAVFAVLLFAAVRILTMEKRSVYDYIKDVRSGGETKRWQGAFELSRILSNPQSVPQEGKFIDEMSAVFEASKHDDERVRQYLALAMGRSGRQEFVKILLDNLTEPTLVENNQGSVQIAENMRHEKDENLYAFITALGILKNSSATDALLKFLDSDLVRIRLAAVIALGNIADPKAVEPLKLRLNDPEVNVMWDAAIALAKMGDRSGRGVILNLLDREYLSKFPNVDPQNQSRIVSIAIQASQGWNDPEINAVLKKLFETDKNMNVRNLAHQSLNPKI